MPECACCGRSLGARDGILSDADERLCRPCADSRGLLA